MSVSQALLQGTKPQYIIMQEQARTTQRYTGLFDLWILGSYLDDEPPGTDTAAFYVPENVLRTGMCLTLILFLCGGNLRSIWQKLCDIVISASL